MDLPRSSYQLMD